MDTDWTDSSWLERAIEASPIAIMQDSMEKQAIGHAALSNVFSGIAKGLSEYADEIRRGENTPASEKALRERLDRYAKVVEAIAVQLKDAQLSE